MRLRRSLGWIACLGWAAGISSPSALADPPAPQPKDPAMADPAPGMDDAGKDDAAMDGGGDDAAPEPSSDRGLAIGTVAPPLEVTAWSNCPTGKEPTAESMKGKVVFVEFWETQCGPCIRQMPKVQALHERWASEGVVVVGISWEAVGIVERFVKAHDVTFPQGIDPSKGVIEAYKIGGYPTSYVIGRDGKVAAVTYPARAEFAVEKALGLGTDAVGALADYLDAVERRSPKSARLHLERVIEKATKPVDLKAFAAKAGGIAPTVAGKSSEKVDGSRSLSDLAKARAISDAAKARAVLDALAAGGPEKHDLLAWARDTLARDFPVTAAELKELVAAKRFDALVGAVLDRRPSADAMAAVLKSDDLQGWCSKQAPTERQRARRGLLLEDFVLRMGADGWKPKSQEVSTELFHELASSSCSMDKDRKPIGMDIDGTMLMKDTVSAWIDRQYARALVMESIAAGKRPDPAKVATEVAKARKQTLDALKAKYGG